MYTIKIKHGFDLYHHALNGYYPSWDEVYQQYTAKAIDQKWSHWKAFFLMLDNEVLEQTPSSQMMSIYASESECGEACQKACQLPPAAWEMKRPLDNPM